VEGSDFSRMLSLHLPGVTEETAKNFRPDNIFPDLDLNLGPPEQVVISLNVIFDFHLIGLSSFNVSSDSTQTQQFLLLKVIL
jgi:hypothetical protein